MDVNFQNGVLSVSRIYDAPIERVFDAWVEVNKTKQWWGCAQCVSVNSEIEPKIGGAYNHHMVIKNDYGRHELAQLAVFVEYDPPYRLAYRSIDDDDPIIVAVDFNVAQTGTKIHITHTNIPDMIVGEGQGLGDVIRDGWTAAFGKLDNFLAKEMVL